MSVKTSTVGATHHDAHHPRAYWGAVFAMTLCVFALIASEFMPVSLLTPIAAELQVSEGWAGYGIAISGAFAVLRSEEHTSELQSLMRISYAVFCLKTKNEE